jgi:hypothetical protein
MFGHDKKVGDMLDEKTREKNRAALAVIAKSLKGNQDTLVKEKGGSLIKGVVQSVEKIKSSEKSKIQHELEHLTETLAYKIPAIFAANSNAERDHEYSLYRGRRAQSIDSATQMLIYDKKGIELPNTAAMEMVADQLYSKNYKDMTYNQILQAAANLMKYSASKDGKLDFEDQAEGLAMMMKLKEESWQDDLGGVMDAVKVRDKTFADMKGTLFSDPSQSALVSRVEKRAARTQQLSPDNYDDIGGLLGRTLGDSAAKILTGLRNGLSVSQVITPQIQAQLHTALQNDIKVSRTANIGSVGKLINLIQERAILGDMDYDRIVASAATARSTK